MCLLFISWRVNPRYPFVIAGNRDEFWKRKTEPLQLRQKGRLLCGRDMEAGGTWLGVNVSGRFAGLTNIRLPGGRKAKMLSRGELVLDCLTTQGSIKELLTEMCEKSDRYNPFNLFAGDRENLFFLSSRNQDVISLKPGFYGLSNGDLDEPWPKLTRGKKLLRALMCDSAEFDPSDIFSRLADCKTFEDAELPSTGVGLQWERLLSTLFISGSEYGTRSSALIFSDTRGNIDFYEKSHVPSHHKNSDSSLVHFRFHA